MPFREELAEGASGKRSGVINLAYFAANASRQAAVAAFIAGLEPELIRVRGAAVYMTRQT